MTGPAGLPAPPPGAPPGLGGQWRGQGLLLTQSFFWIPGEVFCPARQCNALDLIPWRPLVPLQLRPMAERH